MTIKELFNHAIGVAKFADFSKFYNWFTKNNHTLKGDVAFEGGVDFTGATVTGAAPFFATEIEAIDAGLAFGDKYMDSDGVIQTVTKIKQTITLPAGVINTFGFLIDLDSLESKDITDVFQGYAGYVRTIDGGLLKDFTSTQNPIFNTLTSFTNGRGYWANPTVAFSITLYGNPLNEAFHTDLISGQNVVVHNSATTSSTNATSWIGLTIVSVTTYVNSTTQLNPTTWNSGQAYFVTTSNGPQAAIGLPATPIPVDRSNGAVGQVLVPNADGDAVWGTPFWTTATRPTPLSGQYPSGFNTTTSKHEGWNGSTWNNFY